MSDRRDRISDLLRLSHELGNPSSPLAILAEGNTSTRFAPRTFLVKASGSNLASSRPTDFVECLAPVLLPLLDRPQASDHDVESTLLKSRVNPKARKPSVESLFHAWLLTLPEIEFVGHAHAPAVNSILCSPRARTFAQYRIFPDEVVCCDAASVFVPYTDPGLQLARKIRELTGRFMREYRRPPRVILLQNHGIITLGRTADAVLAAMFMAEKAARIWLGAAALGGPVFLKSKDVQRLAGRADEKLRRRILNL